MKDYKLTIDLLPMGAWNNDLSKTLSKKDWDFLRNKCYERANYKCEICGYETNELDAHEVWEFNINKQTQTLKNIVALCSKCHGVKHWRNSKRLGYGENAKRHFMKINNASEIDFANHLTEAQMIFEQRNLVHFWKMVVDLKKFGGEKINFKQIYRKKIENPYTDQDIYYLKNTCNLKPRVLDININNYDGTITIKCDKTNKIEWYDEKGLIKVKYNFGRILINIFSVKNLFSKTISFRLTGNDGIFQSKPFQLSDWDKN